MKRTLCIATLIVCVLLGGARVADLIWNTDAATGFLLSGGVGLRYGLMLVAALLALLAGRYVPRRQPCDLRPGGPNAPGQAWLRGANWLLVPAAFGSELYGFLILLNRIRGVPAQTSSHHADDSAAAAFLRQFSDGTRAALFVAFGVWCLLLFLENRAHLPCGPWMMGLGVLGSVAFYLHTVMRFIERPSSLYRVMPVVEILSTLTALLFITALLRALYWPACPGAARALYRYGLLAFFFCTCLAFPQAVWQSVSGGADVLVTLSLAFVFGCLGLLGAFCAWYIATRRKRPAH